MSGEAKDFSEHTQARAFSKVVRSITVNVYLPKNLINYGTLINLLGEVLEFNRARQYLVRNVEKLLPIVTEQFPEVLADDARDHLLTGDLKGPKRKPVEVLRDRLWSMKKRIQGYSIFEADGAFEHERKGNTIPVHPEKTFKYPRAARVHFENCESIEWLENAATENPEKRGVIRRIQRSSSVSLTVDSSRNFNQTRRILSYKGDKDRRHVFIISQNDNDDTVRLKRCIHLLEERTLVIKFIIPVKDDEGWLPPVSISENAKDALWDVLMLVGWFFAGKLGESGEGLEDEIWISYDLGNLWTWEGGKPGKR